jgi:beta-lactamase regulating signal transducer with metallopeptidase domain
MTHLVMTSTHIATALGWAAVKATAVLALAALLARLRHRGSAAVRHLIWTAALASTVALLVLPLVLPAWRTIPVGVVPASSVGAAGSPTVAPPREPTAVADPRRQTDGVHTRGAPTRTGADAPAVQRPVLPSAADLPLAIIAIWLAGVAAIALRYAWSRLALARLARSSTELAERSAVVELARVEMRIKRPVAIRMSDHVDLPLTWGIAHPVIVLPADATEWTPDRWRHVLKHELAHVQRLDAATQLIGQAAQALFWFHPLVWYAVAQMRRERERACDDCVLTNGAIASDYAADLLALIMNHGYAERHTVGLAFARRSQFEGRLLALLDPTVDRAVVSSRGIAVTMSLSFALIAPLAALQTAESRPARRTNAHAPSAAAAPTPNIAVSIQRPRPSSESARTTSPATVAPIAVVQPALPRPETIADRRTEIQAVGDDVFAPCASDSQHGDSHHDSDASSDGARRVWTANGEIGGCRFDLKSEGEVSFTPGLTGIAQLSPNGYFDASTNIHGDVTRLTVTASAAGTPSFLFTRNGKPLAFSGAGDAWLAQFLVGLDRITAFAVDNRFPVLLQGGAENVLDEIDRMHSGRAKYVYAGRLIQSARLDPAAVLHAANIAAGMSTEHWAADLVVGIADRYPLTDPATRAALIGTALRMTVAHEQARSLLAILGKSTLSATETLAVLQSLTKMDIDAEKTRVLRALRLP